MGQHPRLSNNYGVGMSVQAWLLREKKRNHYQRLNERAQAETHFQALADMLQKGVPELGWEGDPWLKVVYNRILDRIEVVDTHPKYNGAYDTVFTTEPGDASMADPYSMIRRVKLADQRTRTVDDFLALLDQQQEQFEKEQERAENEMFAEQADRLATAVQKDLGPYYGGLSRRYF